MYNCGQNVYSLRTSPWTTCVLASTACEHTLLLRLLAADNPQVLHTITRMLYAQLSTVILPGFTSVISPLIHSFHSTYYNKHQIKKGIK